MRSTVLLGLMAASLCAAALDTRAIQADHTLAAAPVEMKLQRVSSLLSKDGTVDVEALKQHVYSVSAKLSERVIAGEDPQGAAPPRRRRDGTLEPRQAAGGRPRQKCANRGVGRRDLAEQHSLGQSTPAGAKPKTAAANSTPASGAARKSVTQVSKPVQKPAPAPAPHRTVPAGAGGVDGCRAGNFFWSTPIRVGSTEIQAIIDTGSSLTIVDGKVYDAKGATYVKKNFTISFVDGSSAAGHVFNDTVSIAGVNFYNSTVCRDEHGFDLDNAAALGLNALIGLQRPGFSVKSAGIGGLLDRVRRTLRHNLFSLSLTTSAGALFLGQFDPAVPFSKWIFVPVMEDIEGHWVARASINGVVMPDHAVVDSGTSSMLFNHAVAAEVLSKMDVHIMTQDGMLLGVFPCDSPPRITVQLGGYTRILTPESTIMGNVNATTCYASVVGVPEDTQLTKSAILGGPFFTNTYVGFDFVGIHGALLSSID